LQIDRNHLRSDGIEEVPEIVLWYHDFGTTAQRVHGVTKLNDL